MSKISFAAAVLTVFSLNSIAQADFIRGDSNGDARVDISDPAFTNNYLFLGTSQPASLDAADANDDGAVNISDSIHTLNYLFLGGPQPPAPFPNPGVDPTPDGLDSGPDQSVVIPPTPGTALSFSGPPMVSVQPGSPFQINVDVLMDAQGTGVEAWSFGAQVAGGSSRIVNAALGADAAALLDGGFQRTEITGIQSVVSAVNLSLVMPHALDPAGNSHNILSLTLDGIGPAAGTDEIWVLSFVDGLTGSGQPVENISTIEGQSFSPAPSQFTIQVKGAERGNATPEPSTLALAVLGLVPLAVNRRRRRRR